MSTLIGLRDVTVGDVYSPAKEKATNKCSYNHRWSPLLRRVRYLFAAAKLKLALAFCVLCVTVFLTSKISSFMGWIPDNPSPVSSLTNGGYTVLINSWKKNSLLKQSAAHYASCGGTDAIHVVWSETDPPSESFKTYLRRTVFSKSEKPNFKFEISKENLNNRFKPIAYLRTDAVFSVDDDVIVPCSTLDFAFSVWQSAPHTMVGFVPRMHWLHSQNGASYYKYGGWWSVWWMGSYSMVLAKAAFFHKKYLDLYTNAMPMRVRDYVARERNCEDLAMSFLVANATGAPPIWVEGKIHEIGSSGISFKGYSNMRNKCLNDFISLYGNVPLVSTSTKAVGANKSGSGSSRRYSSAGNQAVAIIHATVSFCIVRSLCTVRRKIMFQWADSTLTHCTLSNVLKHATWIKLMKFVLFEFEIKFRH